MKQMEMVSQYKYFLDREKNASPNTVENYTRDVKAYLEELQKDLSDVNKTDIMSYVVKIQSEGKSKSTVSRKLASVRSFYQFLLNEGLIQKDPTINVKVPRPERKLPEPLSIEEVNSLLDAPDETTVKGMRDRAMLELIYSCGIKIGEVLDIEVGDVNLDLEYIRCFKKDSSERYIPLGKDAIFRLREYLDYSRYVLLGEKDCDKLFLNTRGDSLSRQGLWKIIKGYAKDVNIDKNINSALLRHSFAIHMVQNGADIKSVQNLLGHMDLATTQIYQKKSDQKLKDIYKKTHPRA